MSALISHRTQNQHKSFVCPHCIHPFKSEELFVNHFPDCSQHIRQQRVVFLEEGKDILEWKSRNKTQLANHIIYFDMEAYLSPVDQSDASKGKSRVIDEHIPSGFCAYTVSQSPHIPNRLVTYSRPDCMPVFFDHLMKEQTRLASIEGKNIEMLPITKNQQEKYDETTHCKNCDKPFSAKNRKVRHHCHATGNFISALCNSCNLQVKARRQRIHDRKTYVSKLKPNRNELIQPVDTTDKQYKFFISVVGHNMSKYDSKFIFKHFNPRVASKYGGQDGKYPPNVEITALNLEHFISFEIFYLRFIDSLKFLSASLETLVQSLLGSCDHPFDKFEHISEQLKLDDEGKKLMIEKGTFPYEWFSSLEKFNEPSLPPIDSFYSNLKEENITREEYKRAQAVWMKFNCKTFKDYHDLYLVSDVLLLADCFEYFRKSALDSYGLGPSMYLTLPSFSWDACLRFTDIKLQLIRDPKIHLLFENNIRGGVSSINCRYAKANIPDSPDFNSNLPASHILYIDANNLFGMSMASRLPVNNFKFIDDPQNFDVNSIPDDSPVGYVIECDLIYPPELHDSHNCYPLALESLIITENLLSTYCKSFGQKHVECRKLVHNLMNKTKYVVHYQNLKFYLEKGMKLSKIHRVLEFTQSAWMKPSIDFNTKKRQEAKSKVDQEKFKLTVNSLFGKTMEQVRNRRNIQLVCDPNKVKKLTSKPQLEQFRIINDDTALIDRVRAKVTLDKPIYCGFAILELSKLPMFECHYDLIKPKYGDRAKLLFTDTDSLTYHLTTNNLDADLKDLQDHLDTSNYPKDHPLYSTQNAKVRGKFKNECPEEFPIEFVGLRSKMYSLKLKNGSKNTAKGIKTNFVKKRVRHEDYLHVLRTKTITHATFRNFRSQNLKIETVEFKKICLSAYDDKRFLLPDGESTLAYGHYKIPKLIFDRYLR